MPSLDTPTRKLAAIMFTDIAGFTKLSSVDDSKAANLLKTQRDLLQPIVEKHSGSWLKEIGDGLLLTFSGATSALECAIEIQKAIEDIEDLNLRIGIHQGEVIEQDGDIIGDDVNIASRIEPFASIGGIVVSNKIQADISSNPKFTTKFIGKPQLKGVAQKVEVYCITSHNLPETKLSDVSAKLEKKTNWFKYAMSAVVFVALLTYYFIPKDKEVPSIGILMMENLGIEDDNFWSRGITEDLIVKVAGAGLIRVAPMKEILEIDIQKSFEEIAKKLRVKYLLTSSMHKQEDGFDLRCHLIEVKSGVSTYAKKWSESLDNSPTIIGNLADDILKTLKVSSKQDITKAPTTNPEAYEFYLKGKYKFEKRENIEDTEIAQGLLQKAIELDDNLIAAKNKLGRTYFEIGDYDKAMEIYIPAMKKAEELGDKRGLGMILSSIGGVYYDKGDIDKVMDYLMRSLKIAEELDDMVGMGKNFYNMGNVYDADSNHEKALDYYTRSLEIREQIDDKRGMGYSLSAIGNVFWDKRDYDKTLDYCIHALQIQEELGDKRGMGYTLRNIGKSYRDKGDLEKSLEYHTRSLEIREQIDDKRGMGNSLSEIGNVYYDKGDYIAAGKYFNKSLAIKNEIGAGASSLLWTTTYLFLTYEQLDKEYHKEKIFNLIKKYRNINIYELGYRLYQLLEDTSYLETAYNQVQENADHLEPDVKAKFLSYPIPKAIVEEWEKNN